MTKIASDESLSEGESPAPKEAEVVEAKEVKEEPKQKANAPVIPKREEFTEVKEKKRTKPKKKEKADENDASKPAKKEQPAVSDQYPASFANLSTSAMNAIKQIEKERGEGKLKDGLVDIKIGIYEGTYKGEVNQKGEAHGYGKFRSNNCGNNVFDGYFLKNAGQGYCQKTSANGGVTVGEWKDSKFNNKVTSY